MTDESQNAPLGELLGGIKPHAKPPSTARALDAWIAEAERSTQGVLQGRVVGPRTVSSSGAF